MRLQNRMHPGARNEILAPSPSRPSECGPYAGTRPDATAHMHSFCACTVASLVVQRPTGLVVSPHPYITIGSHFVTVEIDLSDFFSTDSGGIVSPEKIDEAVENVNTYTGDLTRLPITSVIRFVQPTQYIPLTAKLDFRRRCTKTSGVLCTREELQGRFVRSWRLSVRRSLRKSSKLVT